jgi:hypothetical protein
MRATSVGAFLVSAPRTVGTIRMERKETITTNFIQPPPTTSLPELCSGLTLDFARADLPTEGMTVAK